MESNISAKNKAKELTNKYWKYSSYAIPDSAKQCALIAVDEVINHCSLVEPWLGVDYWQEVKTEINKL